jgi:hypothetical protein
VHKASSLRLVEFLQRMQSTDANFCLRMHRFVLGEKRIKLVSSGIATHKRQQHRQRQQ